MSFFDEKIVLVLALVLILASLPVVAIFDRDRIVDHVSRTLVAIGVGLMAAFVAVTIFDLNAQKVESERQETLQQAKRGKTLALISNLRFFAIDYGFTAYQLRTTQSDCGAAMVEPAPRSLCREAASYTMNVGRLIPQDYTLITALSEASTAFARAVRVPTLLTDAEVSIKARMPVAIENYIATSLTGDQAPASDAQARFTKALTNFENIADDAATGFCTFAAALEQGESKLEQTISALESALRNAKELPIHEVIRSTDVKNVSMGDVECANLRAQIERSLSTSAGTQ
jgi:hypothetical protein